MTESHAFAQPDGCPCGSGRPYSQCCGVYHRGEAEAPTAVALMRARYSAYARHETDYVFRTWHPATRPEPSALETDLEWVALDIEEVEGGCEHDDLGEVSYAACYLDRDRRRGCLREHSRFTRKGGRWVYLDGDVEAAGA